MTFLNAKKTFLSKPDKSNAGEVDEAIRPLVSLLNSKKSYYTTSSCAGRILLLKEEGKTGRRRPTHHFFVRHDQVSLQELLKAVKNPPQEEIFFHMEGMILHVCCESLEAAECLLDLARDAGLKRSGIISLRKKIMVELIDTQRLDLPVAREGKLLVPEDYLDYLLQEANKKLKETRKKIEKFTKACVALE
ncbi:hypothetical protein HY488_00405 [Candidatus Woesearchaeota archaeon]|nr:hypothetical protein [Candidatus Woesearchaeota archaeon]